MSDFKGWTPNPKLTEADLKAMEPAVIKKIRVARIGLLLRQPFFGNMATRMKLMDGSDFCPTAATDGRNLYYNIEFFSELTTKQVEWVLGHEIYHCIFEHLTRRGGRDHAIFNIACDYAVNGMLEKDQIGTEVDQIKIFKDRPQFDGKSAEEIYEIIFEKHDQAELEQLGQMLDEHIDWEAKDPTGKRPSYSKDELRKIRDEIKSNVIGAAQQAGNGKTPDAVRKMITSLRRSKITWRALIRQQIQSTIKSDFTFQRINRKGWHLSAILPGMDVLDEVDLCVAIDTSGSIGDEQIRDFLSEIKGITDEFPAYKIRVWCFDTSVHNEQLFTSNNGKRIAKYQQAGGGGTEFMCNWEYMKRQGHSPKKFIMFTDGYPWGSWGDPVFCETVFIIHGNHDKELKAPFGVTSHYDEKKKKA
jgi:predicted metal-dependent peptidase